MAAVVKIEHVHMRGLVHVQSVFVDKVTGCGHAYDAPFRMTDEPVTCLFCIASLQQLAEILERNRKRRMRSG